MFSSLRAFFPRFLALFRRDALDRDLAEEISAHLDLSMEENLHAGMSPAEARRQALVQFGGPQQAKEHHRHSRSLSMIETLAQDLRYTFRTLRKDRSFAAIAILILALGIGANIVVFSVVNTLLLRPLPFPHSEQLVWFTGNHGQGGLSGTTYNVGSFEEYSRHAQSFEEITSYQCFWGSSEFTMTGPGDPQHIQTVMVANNFFHTLGIMPIHGRTFLPSEHQKGAAPVAMVTYQFWQSRFAGDPDIVGKSVDFDNRSATIIGVLPPSFDFASVFSPGLRVDFFIPAYMDDIRTWGNTVAIVARLKAGVSLTQAQAEVNILSPQFRAAHPDPDWFAEYPADLSTLKDYVTGKLRRSLYVLWGAVGLILLIVCVNLSNLLLARMASRGKEFAMRTALGATRSRLIRQLVTESLVLSVFGAVLGIALAFGVTSYLAQQGSIALPLLNSIRVDVAALLWTLLITLAVGILFGIVPGLVLSKGHPQDTFRDAGRGSSEGRSHGHMRSILVVAEVALACVLLVGSGLLLLSFLRVLDVDLGFQPSRAAVMDITYDSGKDGKQTGPVLHEIVSEIKALGGVECAGVSDMLPLDRERSWGFKNASREYRPNDPQGAVVRLVTPGYLEAMGVRLIKGRDISWQDTLNNELVVVINESAARLHWPGQDPIGRGAGNLAKKPVTVIGVVSDVRVSSLENSPGAEIYLPVTFGPEGAELVVRSNLPPDALTASVLPILRRITPQQPANTFRPVQSLVDRSVSPRRFFVYLVAVFAALGLLLAALGVYGVISYSVTRQTREIGIRMALGATPGIVQRSVLGRTLKLALGGIAVGAVASFAASQAIASLLFKTDSADPATFAGVSILLVLVALLAGYFPALRATRIDPTIALRSE
jgi:predicted permease